MPESGPKMLDSGSEMGMACRSRPSTKGEICISMPQVMARYWQRAEDTGEVFCPNGHLRTGDVGTVVGLRALPALALVAKAQ
ncbi:hypothetical protein HpMS107_33550 [Helicobacter pylori]|jgi:long-subunit acyl-CoA synthetase (AMP-forming)|uniref:Uncharacterized protein n=1 Tax=Cupriavidus metallidurans TaxID=119219 RepID=A0A482IMG0_9BURK|nr:AMP-binding protein [Cupriavidus sp. SHE]QBP09948.1 hypothetical protein DDF84_009320 [Cupriavidus metallidurans]